MLKVNIQTNGPMFLSHIGPWKHQSEHSILYWTVLAQAKKSVLLYDFLYLSVN